MYSPPVLEHFAHPRNAGTLDSPDAVAEVANPACGDILRLSAKFAGDRITEVKFLAKGCVPAIACGSAMTELLIGKTIVEAASISREELVTNLGGLPEASNHASHLAIDAVARLLKKISSRRMG
jgi:nitrogen fixation protein NifU and related proteins